MVVQNLKVQALFNMLVFVQSNPVVIVASKPEVAADKCSSLTPNKRRGLKGCQDKCQDKTTSVLTSAKAVSIVPSGSNKMDVRRENTDVR
jgi:hypothetical protein